MAMVPNNGSSPIRLVIVDDSLTVRELLTSLFLNAGMLVVGTGTNGEDAIRLVKRLRPDVLLMDVRMPKMDGLEATRRIMHDNPTRIVLVTGSMMRSDSDLTFQALQAGALTVLSKPGLNDPATCEHILKVVQTMAGALVIHHWHRTTTPRRPEVTTLPPSVLKPESMAQVADISIVGIAASTGGPAAIAAILNRLPKNYPVPILLVQHISMGFAVGLADWLSTQTKLQVDLAGHGCSLQPGVVLLAPDDYHIQVNERGVVELSKAPPFKGLRPSANPMFESLARVFGPRALGVILTGMGDDGAVGMEALHQAGGLTLAQDEDSCIVFGMPKEAINLSAVDYVLSLEQIADVLMQRMHREKLHMSLSAPRE